MTSVHSCCHSLMLLMAMLYCSAPSVGALTSVTSWREQPITVQRLDVINDMSRQSVTSTDATQRLSLRLSLTASSHVLLNLTRSQFVDDQTPVYVASHGNVSRWTKSRLNHSFTVFTDATNHAVMLVQSTVTSSGHVIKNYEGTFRLGDDNYLLTTVTSQRRQRRQAGDDDETTTTDRHDYVVYRIQQSPDNFTDDDEVSPGDNDWLQYSNVTSQFPLYVIELLMVIDYAIYRSWYELSRERTSADKSSDAINSIRYYYTHVAAGMDLRFDTMQAADFNIKIRFVGIYIATTPSDSPWTESSQSRFVVDDIVYTKSGKALDLFQTWIVNTAPSLDLPPFDQATLFTGNIVTSSSSDKNNIRRISGLGNIAALCTSRRVTICQEWNMYASVGTATHELGHNLGSYHDGQGNDCSSLDQYIMAKTPTQLTDGNFFNPYQFSHCSINYFRAYLNQLNMQNINCLLNSSRTDVRRVDETILLPPGQFIPVDKQCQMLYGSRSFYCASATNDESICERMLCYVHEMKQCHTRTEQRAANGTTCGDRMWCRKGRCVTDKKAPRAAAHCVYGDSKAPFDDGTTCVTKLAASPGLCYQHQYNSTCCYTCQQIRNQHSSDCAYGDHDDDYCSTLVSHDCYDQRIRRTCCATCRRSRRYLPGCEYGDRATWCRTMTEGSQCYEAGKSHTCCFTCNHLRSYGSPGCEYGDRATWCKSYTVQQCQQQTNLQHTCCFTCNGTTNNIDTNCRDHADWCPTLSPSYCYATDRTCCRTCRAYNIHVPGCEYGDRYSWCNSTMRRDDCRLHWNVDDCCYTCYLLANVTRTTPTSVAGPSSVIVHLTTVYLLLVLLASLSHTTH